MSWARTFLFLGVALAAGAMACGGDDSTLGGGGGSSGAVDPYSKENASEEAGAQAIQKRRCVECHDSPSGKMAGRAEPIANKDPSVELYPPNLTPDVDTGIGGWSDDQLANAIRTGLDKEGLNLCPQMQHFADMSDFEVYSIVKYLRTLPAVKNQVPRSVCPPLKLKEEQNLPR